MLSTATKRILDLSKRGPKTATLLKKLKSRIVGQEQAVQVLVDIVERYDAGLCGPTRPVGSALLLGGTGSGKTYAVETLCEALTGDPQANIKINCAEFQLDHELCKLLGSPPGFLGHRETKPVLTQEALTRHHTDTCKLSVILVDEIEKASDTLWQLFLGILDKAVLTLGDNSVVNFSQTLIVFTSNLGAKEIVGLHEGGIGYRPGERPIVESSKLHEVALGAAKRKFTPEFMNRIDKTVVFKTLTEEDMETILNLELARVSVMLVESSTTNFYLTPEAKAKVFSEGYSKEYGARNMKRTIEKRVTIPMSRLLSSNQVTAGETVIISEVGAEEFEYSVEGRVE